MTSTEEDNSPFSIALRANQEESFPVLRAFESYIEAEREKSRKRLMTVSICFGVVLVSVIILFCVIGSFFMRSFMETQSRLMDAVLPRQQPVATQPYVQQIPQQNFVQRQPQQVPIQIQQVAPQPYIAPQPPVQPEAVKPEPQIATVEVAKPENIVEKPKPIVKEEQIPAVILEEKKTPKKQEVSIPEKVAKTVHPKAPAVVKPTTIPAPVETGKKVEAPNGQRTETVTISDGSKEIPWQIWTK